MSARHTTGTETGRYRDRDLIRASAGRAGSVLQVQEVLQRRSLVTIAEATRRSGLTYATVPSALESLEQLGLVREIPDRPARTFQRYLAILEQGTEPLQAPFQT